MQPPADAPDLHHDPDAPAGAAAPPVEQRVPAPRGAEVADAAHPAGQPVAPAPVGLTEREEQILGFESKWWKHAGSKEQAVRDTFGLSATRYYQLLNGLLDNPAALEHDPVLVARLRRLRSTRARARRR